MSLELRPLLGLKSPLFQSVLTEVAQKLRHRKLKLATAESCTGGLFSTLMTEWPGSSQFFDGSVVAYDNSFKTRFLNVSHEDLETYGAVSPEIAQAMATGLSRLTQSDICLSFTGIAGPAGGTDKKPVGLVYMSVAYKEDPFSLHSSDFINNIARLLKHPGTDLSVIPSASTSSWTLRILTDGSLLHDLQTDDFSRRSRIRWTTCFLALEMLRRGL